MSDFQEQLRALLNANSKENESDTPDYILAQYLSDCLDAYNKALKAREQWHGRDINHP